ncbi:MAG: ABC transporter permease [Alphaproteobacteria bacterium]|nr:ABC transporter permease [Alphaproteobacteria bacterium]
MIRFLVGRVFQSSVVLLVMSFVVYGLIGLMPGDPVDLMISADPKITPEGVAKVRAIYGLDRPITARYADWLAAALQGDFGASRLHGRPLPEVIGPALFNTVRLMGAAFALSLLIGLPLGLLAGARPRSPFDYVVNMAAFAGVSMPSFWLGLLLIIVFSVLLGALPAGGMGTVETGLADTVRHMILPVATLAVAGIAGHARYMRAALAETLRQDYIRTARAKGAGETRVVLGHALRNALIPVVTIIALDFGALFSGALITETIFSYPGMGRLIFEAIMGNDFNLALVALLFATLLTLIANLAADAAYIALDPRVSFEGRDP